MGGPHVNDGLNAGQRYYLKNKEKRRAQNSANAVVYYRRLRTAVLELLGSKCCSPGCRWHNVDGTYGCNDVRILQVDHINGGGKQELQAIRSRGVYRKILQMENPKTEYQLLCPCCNWIKRVENGEQAGAPRRYQY